MALSEVNELSSDGMMVPVSLSRASISLFAPSAVSPATVLPSVVAVVVPSPIRASALLPKVSSSCCSCLSWVRALAICCASAWYSLLL